VLFLADNILYNRREKTERKLLRSKKRRNTSERERLVSPHYNTPHPHISKVRRRKTKKKKKEEEFSPEWGFDVVQRTSVED